MNNVDFKKIRNQFKSMVQSFDEPKISNQKIFSVCFDLENNFKDFLDRFSSEYCPIFFSNDKFSAFSLLKEHSFAFYEEDDFKIQKKEMIDLISNALFINSKKDYKTFIFGGFNFDLNESNNDIWEGVPIGGFTLPRYTFIDSKLIINIFLKNKATKIKIEEIIYKYINDLEGILFKTDQSTVRSKLLKISNLTSKDSYFSKIKSLLKNLKEDNSELIKVVFSRIKKASFSDKVPLIDIYKNLMSNHGGNMNFLYTIKDNISIIGSTPELILSKLNSQIKSESIAGSNYIKKTDEFILDEKEIVEQKIVTDYIINFLNENAVDIKYNNKPQIRKSSNIEHLCTSFSATLDTNKNIFDLLNDLHPTPAIGGFPKQKAINLIRDKKENRGWYGGPIGWIDNNLDGHFFLNIRSGLGINSDLYLFSGSGITDKSKSDNEWSETEQKFNLMIESL